MMRSTLFLLMATASLIAQSYTVSWTQRSVLDNAGEDVLAVLDFNGDGASDVLVGGSNEYTEDKTPIYLLINNGDGSLSERTDEFIDGSPVAATPIGVQGDFNGDGLDDIVVFDAGNMELGQAPTGGFYGEEPFVIFSKAGEKHFISTQIADAERAGSWYANSKMHLKSATSGDIDGDGDLDIFVESGGGFETIPSHFFINQGDGTFTIDAGDSRISQDLVVGPDWQTHYMRWSVHKLVDLNGDGYPDLVMGYLKRWEDVTSENQPHNKVVYNDGNGKFQSANAVDLPFADWNQNWNKVTAIGAGDIDGDGRTDLVIAHTRNPYDTGLHAPPDNVGGTGRYLQVLRNNGDNSFSDLTADYLGDQSHGYGQVVNGIYNSNSPEAIIFTDMNADGYDDIVLAKSWAMSTPANPLIYFKSSSREYTALDSSEVLEGDRGWGDNKWVATRIYPVELTGDSRPDLIYHHAQPGPDNQYGTSDDRSDIVPIHSVKRVELAVDEYGQTPERFELYPNYPNPFNIQTTIGFYLPVATRISIQVHTVTGHHVVTALDEWQRAGYGEGVWNGTDLSGNPLPSGVYLYQVSVQGISRTGKMVLIK